MKNAMPVLNVENKKRKTAKSRSMLCKKRAKRKTKKKQSGVPPSSYVTVPYYFPTKQVDIVNKLRRRKRKGKKPS